MSVPSTNEEWAKIIDEITKEADQARGENESKPTISSSSLTAKSLAKTIDHTLLKLDATEEQVTQLCDEAKEYDFAVSHSSPHQIRTRVELMIYNPSACASTSFRTPSRNSKVRE